MTELLKVGHLTKHFPVGGGKVVDTAKPAAAGSFGRSNCCAGV